MTTVARRSSIGLVLVALTAACSTDPQAPPDFVTRDSAGISIAESGAPRLTGADGWRIDPTPRLEIGAVEGDEAETFTRIWDATRLPDGRLVVVDEMTMELRVFDASGTHQRTFGGAGDGPGEFVGPAFIAARADGDFVAWDGGRVRLSRYDPDGEVLDGTSLQEPLGELGIFPFRNGRVWEVDDQGTVLATGPQRPRPTQGIRDRFKRIVVLSQAGTAHHDFGLFPSSQSFVVRVERASIGVGNPYAPAVSATLVDGKVALSGSDAWEVRVHEPTGELVRVIRAAIPRTPVTAVLAEAGLDQARQMAESSPLTLSQAEEAYGQVTLPDSVPAVGLMYAQGQTLWVARRTGRWYEHGDLDVFDAEGRWITTVALPPDIQQIHEIGADYVLASVTDELDVPYLRMYALDTGG